MIAATTIGSARSKRSYHEALRLPEEERSASIARACASDDDLRREVEKLLSFDRKAGRFMESPAPDVAAQALAMKAEPGKKIDLIR